MTTEAIIQGVMAETDAQVAKNLRQLADTYQLDQGTLADIMGKKRSWVQERLSGRTKLSLADARGFCRVFGIADTDILFTTDRFELLGYVAENPSDLLDAPSRWKRETPAPVAA
jgi:transcriptional regulator with XRE-family HTH domain